MCLPDAPTAQMEQAVCQMLWLKLSRRYIANTLEVFPASFRGPLHTATTAISHSGTLCAIVSYPLLLAARRANRR